MIKVIAFDFGDVLVKDTLKSLEKKYWTRKVSSNAKEEFLRALHKVDTGKADDQYLIKVLHNTLTPTLTEEQIQKHLFATKLLPPWSLMKKLQKNYPIAILTNNHKQGPSDFAKILKINLAPYKIINSAVIGVRKPHNDYYKVALKKLNLKPEELVFIDDVPSNVAGAKKAGISSFRYNKNMPQLRAFLKKHGVSGI